MTTKTRFKLTVIAGLFLACITVLAVVSKMEMVATCSITAMMTILSAYIWAQTKRPSSNEIVDNDTDEQSNKDTIDDSADYPRIHTPVRSWTKDNRFEQGEVQVGKDTGADGSAAKTN